MNRHIRSPHPNWVKILAGCTAILCCFPAAAVAQWVPPRPGSPPTAPRSGGPRLYTPPAYTPFPGPPPTGRRMGGTRSGSCTSSGETTLTALAPYSHTGTTRSAQPTFAWYVPDSQPLSLEFRLYVYDADGHLDPQPVYKTTQLSTTGIMTLTLPPEVSLSPGKTYYWQVALLCNPAYPSENLVVGADIQVVDLAAPEESGLWYDQLKATLHAEPSSSSSLAIDPSGLDLLTELADIERNMSENLAAQAQVTEGNESEALQEMSIQLLQQSEQLSHVIQAEQE